jgi:hypothetical protein
VEHEDQTFSIGMEDVPSFQIDAVFAGEVLHLERQAQRRRRGLIHRLGDFHAGQEHVGFAEQ